MPMDKLDSAMHKAAVLTEALPYIQDFCGSTVLVKVGGSVMESDATLDSLLAAERLKNLKPLTIVLSNRKETVCSVHAFSVR